MGKKSAQGGKGKRKNNGPAEERYRSTMRWEKNAARKQRKHFARHPNDNTVVGTVPIF